MKRRYFLAVSVCLAAACADAGEIEHEYQDEEEVQMVQDGLYVSSTKTWGQGANIPVCWETTGLDTEKAWIRDAIWQSWEAASSVRFSGWGACTTTSKGLRVKLQDARG